MGATFDSATICLASRGHPWNDPRIFLKEACSLAQVGYRVHMAVCGDGVPDQEPIAFHFVPIPRTRLERFLCTSWRVFRKARSSRAEVLHIHEPELLLFGLLFKARGGIAIYDAHEDLPKQILGKEWLPAPLRRWVAWFTGKYELLTARGLDAVIAATPGIRRRFDHLPRTIEIRNYPLVSEFDGTAARPQRNRNQVCYAGLLSTIRGAVEMVKAISGTSARLALAGPFQSEVIRRECMATRGWNQVDELGVLDRRSVLDLLYCSTIGLCLFQPLPNHLEAMPTKVFEYMAAGLPVIVSDFPALREIVEGSGAGICVNPRDSREVARTISFLLENPERMQALGRCGQKAVAERYNWASEAQALTGLYRELLSTRKS